MQLIFRAILTISFWIIVGTFLQYTVKLEHPAYYMMAGFWMYPFLLTIDQWITRERK